MTYANQLTVLRMAFVPLFVLLLLYQKPSGALGVFLIAGLTDVLDGFVARHFGQKSELGMFLDPIADKLLLVSSFVVLSLPSLSLAVSIPLWLTITVISRDVLLIVSVLVINLIFGRVTFPPSLAGKLTTFFQLLTVFLVLMTNHLGEPSFFFPTIFYVSFVMTVISGVHYLIRGMQIMAEESAG